MITYGNIYLVTEDFEQLVTFYKTLFEKEVTSQNKTRYAIFDINGLGLSILNGKFDREHPEEVVRQGQYNETYDDMEQIMKTRGSGRVVINLCSNDLEKEYQRINALGIGRNLTQIRYINAKMPYYYFSMQDPDDNLIEITGAYAGKIED